MDAATWYLDLPSERNAIVHVEPFLRGIRGLHVLGERRFHDFVVAITEAVNNAIIHGNQLDANKDVRLEVLVLSQAVIAMVHDRGSGFDPQAVPDPRLPENLYSEGGRGVFLIRHLADEVTFHHEPGGMRVEIRYDL
jgi:serine/threonine-protein kinase RsbW